MLGSLKIVSNPLTIIGIFAALAEVSATVALTNLDEVLRPTFMWFVMLFPTLLVLLFFATLNFNSRVLYAPGDFKDEKNFLSIMKGSDTLGIGPGIEITRDNSSEAIRRITESNKPLITDASRDGISQTRLDAANSFFVAVLGKTDKLFEKDMLSSIGFRMHSDEFFVLKFEIDKEKLDPNVVDEIEFIIHVFGGDGAPVQFEVIGKKISDDNLTSFAEKVSTEIETITTRQLAS